MRVLPAVFTNCGLMALCEVDIVAGRISSVRATVI